VTGHLVLRVSQPIEPHALCTQLRDAHAFLVAAARETVPRLMQLSLNTWGSDAKREHVVLPATSKPDLVSPGATTHSFAEVVNQCATLERLIDTLGWAGTVPGLNNALVVTCNPTTSSALRIKGQSPRPADHDLVMQSSSGDLWKFEVSDVASEKDGNDKEKKELNSLGVRLESEPMVAEWPSGRIHLVVSSEFARRLRKHTRHGARRGLFHYCEVKNSGATRIFEVRRGPVLPSGSAPQSVCPGELLT
jgi:hypothetical protein